jgi:hypothetical protein
MVKRLAVAMTMMMVATHAVTAQTSQGARIAPREEQIAAAVLPLPADMRETATVMGYDAQGKLVRLKDGTGGMTCLASDPQRKDFHVACYHKSMEPFMARGRELRGQGVKDPQVDSVRFREAKSGSLKLPTQPASLYSITAQSYDPQAGPSGARSLFVVYIPYATAQSTGLTEKPAVNAPWIMFAGTPKAHIMFVPKM